MKAITNQRQDPYEFFKEHLKGSEFGDSLYSQADRMYKSRTYYSITDDYEGWLEEIKEEIIVRVKITKYEIFTIGELLTKAKPLCSSARVRFKDWIEDNFEFSYETAKNFMNVYENCFAYRAISENIPASIMYKLAAPNFSEELRDYLFTQGNLKEMSTMHFSQIIKKYQELGLDGIKEDIKAINREMVFYNQTRFIIDLAKREIQRIEELKDKINSVLGTDLDHRDSTALQPEANEIVEILYEMFSLISGNVTVAVGKCEDIKQSLVASVKSQVA